MNDLLVALHVQLFKSHLTVSSILRYHLAQVFLRRCAHWDIPQLAQVFDHQYVLRTLIGSGIEVE